MAEVDDVRVHRFNGATSTAVPRTLRIASTAITRTVRLYNP